MLEPGYVQCLLALVAALVMLGGAVLAFAYQAKPSTHKEALDETVARTTRPAGALLKTIALFGLPAIVVGLVAIAAYILAY